MRRGLLLALSLAALSSVASGYYHWTYFFDRDGVRQSARLKFDVTALPNQTVSFFIAKQGPAKLVDGDSLTALTSQIRRAGLTWNVSSSALAVKFGGYQEKSFDDVRAEQVTPGIDVIFNDDLPPGVLAQSEPMTYTDIHYLAEKDSRGFAPILRSRLQLASDLASRNQASWSDAFFLTIVHEFGHTLGLQHSMTAGAMATSLTRGTSKAAPLTADDIAGLSVLYPTPEFRGATGAIAGKVAIDGTGANLASVVALGADGTAIGSMTQPDGTYRIEGLPPGDYIVYSHPLPPAQEGEANPAGIVPPEDLERSPILATSQFETRFYPNTMEWSEATKIKVQATQVTGGIDFNPQRTSTNGLYNLQVVGYLGAGRDKIVHAPPLPVGFRDWLAVQAPGIVTDGQILPGLRFSAVGDAGKLETNTLRDFSNGFLLIVGNGLAATKRTPVTVTMRTDTDLYVLPNAFSVVPSKHSTISSVDAYTDGLSRPHAIVSGTNLTASTRVLFDGADALSVSIREDGKLDIEAPPSAGTHGAAVELLGADGQTASQLLAGAAPPKYLYQGPADPSLVLSPGEIVAGTEQMVIVDGVFTDFLSGRTGVGFGTSDVTVRQVWLVNRNRVIMNVSANAQAKPGTVAPTIDTGLQFVTLGPQLQVRPADPKAVTLVGPVVNETTGLAGAPEGATIAMRAAGVPEDLNGWRAEIAGLPVALNRAGDGRLLAVVPSGIGFGPQQLKLSGPNGVASAPVLFQVDAPPPAILDFTGPSAANLSAARYVHPGDRVSVVVAGLAEGLEAVDPGAVTIRVAGLRVKADLFEKLLQQNVFRLEFTVPLNAPAGEAIPVTVGVGTRVSPALFLGVVAPTLSAEASVE